MRKMTMMGKIMKVKRLMRKKRLAVRMSIVMRKRLKEACMLKMMLN